MRNSTPEALAAARGRRHLLGRRPARGATLLRGDPDQAAELIDSSRYAKKYTSGVLSFAEADLPPEQKWLRRLFTGFRLVETLV